MLRSIYGVLCVSLVLIGGSVFADDDEKKPEGWQTTLALGGTKNGGNSETVVGNASIRAENVSDTQEIRLGAEGTYGESEVTRDGDTVTETTAQKANAYANGKYVFENKAYVYMDTTLDHDDLADLSYRWLLGPGVGFFVYDTEAAKVGVETGLSYLFQKLGGENENYGVLRLAERYDQKLSESAKIWQTIEYMPRVDDTENYLINAEVGIDAAINSTLSLQLVFQDNYNNRPAPDKKNNDYSIITAIAVKL